MDLCLDRQGENVQRLESRIELECMRKKLDPHITTATTATSSAAAAPKEPAQDDDDYIRKASSNT